MNSTITNLKQERSPLGAIIIAGLIVGTLDILAASIQTLINGRNPVGMLKFVASGVFGPEIMTGSDSYALLGLLFHFCIAMGWTGLFFFLYARMSWMRKNKFLTGVIYGLFVQIMMSQIVLKLANTPPIPFRLKGQIIAAGILIVAIGIPLAFLADRHYRSKT
ncbi:MAG TPA: hypothetical protein VGD65_04730 [Chryseosolibacter sp.]